MDRNKAFVVVVSVLTLALIAFLVFRVAASQSLREGLGLARNFVFAEGVAREDSGRTNFVILGKAGEGSPAPDLTDTIIFASVRRDGPRRIDLLPIPRDIWIEDLRAKLNSAYFWGGIPLVKSSVEEIVGVPVHYAMVVDFSGFRELIDFVGGIDVVVDKSFTDERFPVPGRESDLCDGDRIFSCRYETVKFEKGMEHMDGERALKFVRSRMSEDKEEGTDTARSKRQQKVTTALLERVFSPEILLSPEKLLGLREITNRLVERDIKDGELAAIARTTLEARGRLKAHSLDERLLVNPPISPKYDNLYVFIPKGEGWEDTHQWIQNEIF